MGGKITDCIRIRRPREELSVSPPPAPKPATDPELDDQIPW